MIYVDELLDKLQSNIREATKCFLNEPFSNNLVQCMRQSIINTLRDQVFEMAHIKFEIEKSAIPGQIDISPKNLYTLLAFNGINVPYSFIEGKQEYVVRDNSLYFGGGTFVYNGIGSYFKPRENLEYIVITTSLKK